VCSQIARDARPEGVGGKSLENTRVILAGFDATRVAELHERSLNAQTCTFVAVAVGLRSYAQLGGGGSRSYGSAEAHDARRPAMEGFSVNSKARAM
jgi:hypothetical protein